MPLPFTVDVARLLAGAESSKDEKRRNAWN